MFSSFIVILETWCSGDWSLYCKKLVAGEYFYESKWNYEARSRHLYSAIREGSVSQTGDAGACGKNLDSKRSRSTPSLQRQNAIRSSAANPLVIASLQRFRLTGIDGGNELN